MGIEHAIVIFLLAFGSGFMAARENCGKVKCVTQDGGIQRCTIERDLTDFSINNLHGDK